MVMEAIRNQAASFMVKTLLTLLVLSFAAWGIGDYLTGSNQDPVAVVNGQGISPNEFARAYDERMRQIRQMTNGQVTKEMAEMLGVKSQVLQSLVNRRLVSSAVRDLSLTVSPDNLQRVIQTNPAFQADGQFNMTLYTRVLSQQRMSPEMYERRLAAAIADSQLESAARTPPPVPAILVDAAYRLENETRKAVIWTLDPKVMEPRVTVTAGVLEKYLADNANAFMTQTKVKLHYALLNADSVRDEIKVPEEEVLAHYEENQASFMKKETRAARHILVRSDGGDEADKKALAKIKKVQALLQGGRSFESAAKEFSDDPSGQQGGDLGTFGRGMMVGPFEEVAFSLKAGEVSDVVKTDFGYHLIRVDQINAGKTKSLEESRPLIEAKIAERMAQDAVFERAGVLEDQLFTSGDLPAIAKDLNLRFKTMNFFARGEPRLGGVETEQKFLEAAFSLPKGDLSPMIELPDGQFLAIQVLDRQEARPQTMEEAGDAVKNAYVAAEARALAKKRMEELLAALKSGTEPEEKEGVVKITPPPFKPGADGLPGVHAQARRAAFGLNLEQPVHGEVIGGGAGLSLVKLLEINAADPAKMDAATRADITKKLAQEMEQDYMTAFLAGLRSGAKIELNQEVLDRF